MPLTMQNRTKKKQLKKPSKKSLVDSKEYQVVVKWSKEDECFLAEVPALYGCITHGQTAEEALKNGQEAAHLWIDDAIKHGDPIPTPLHPMSGKMTLRLPKSLHQKIAQIAERDGVSINQWIVTKLASG